MSARNARMPNIEARITDEVILSKRHKLYLLRKAVGSCQISGFSAHIFNLKSDLISIFVRLFSGLFTTSPVIDW